MLLELAAQGSKPVFEIALEDVGPEILPLDRQALQLEAAARDRSRRW